MNKNDEKISKYYSVLNKIFIGILAAISIGAGLYNGVNSNSSSGLISWTVGGFLGALLIVIIFIAIDFVLNIWGKSADWQIKHIRKYPYARLWILFPGILSLFYIAYLAIKFLEFDISLRIIISLYFVLVFPVAIISLIRDDLRKERTRLSEIISRETRIHNPQAAVENAFTHFEDTLLKRVSGDSSQYGNRLIKYAYEGEKSKLIYKSDGKDYTAHLYNLMSGAYSIFRNPRHHKIVDDEEDKAQILISISELLIEFIEASEDRENKASDSSKTQ